MSNAELARILAADARAMRAVGENLYRLRAYRRAAFALQGLDRPAAELAPAELADVPGIGPKLAVVIHALATAADPVIAAATCGHRPPGSIKLVN